MTLTSLLHSVAETEVPSNATTKRVQSDQPLICASNDGIMDRFLLWKAVPLYPHRVWTADRPMDPDFEHF